MRMKPPERPEDISGALVQDLAQALGTDLLSVCLYGSAAGGRYVKGKSDLNLLVVTADGAGRVLSRLIPFCQKWAPAAVAPPLVVTPEYIRSSLDVFPIEFTVMAAQHQCLHGEDPLAGITVQPTDLRLQLERELKGKLTTLKTRLLASGSRPEALSALVREALPAFTALFQAWLKLTAGGFPAEPAAVLDALTAQGQEVQSFRTLAQVRAGALKPGPGELVSLLEGAASELSELCRRVDAMEVSPPAGAAT